MLLQLIFEIRNLSVIGIIPDFPPIEILIILIRSPVIIKFEANCINIVQDLFHLQWLYDIQINVASIKWCVGSKCVLDEYWMSIDTTLMDWMNMHTSPADKC